MMFHYITMTVTTDVRNVCICRLEDTDNYILQCGHVTGSNARGCVYFIDRGNGIGNITGTIARSNSAGVAVELSDISNAFDELLAYDLEFDNTTGTLPISGNLSNTEMCTTSTTTGNPSPKTRVFIQYTISTLKQLWCYVLRKCTLFMLHLLGDVFQFRQTFPWRWLANNHQCYCHCCRDGTSPWSYWWHCCNSQKE